MATGTKPRRRAKRDADAIRAAGRADAARCVRSAEAERELILTKATHRASVIVGNAKVEAANEAARLREEALQDAKRIREEAVQEMAKLLSTLTNERDHVLGRAPDDTHKGADETAKTSDAKLETPAAPTAEEKPREAAAEKPGATSESDAPSNQFTSATDLDQLFFAGDSKPAATGEAVVLQRRRKKRFGRH